MPDFTCSECGRHMPGDATSAGLCSACSASSAIATPEHAEQAKVTLPLASDGAIRAGEPPVEQWVAPSIRKDMPAIVARWLPYLIVGAILSTACCVLFPKVQSGRTPAAEAETGNNLRQLGTAFHNYNAIHRSLPTPTMTVMKDGKHQEVQLSWRVAILPHLEQDSLWRAFDQSLAWDDPKNGHLQRQMPAVYTDPFRQKTTSTQMTHFQLFTGPDTLFPNNNPRKFEDLLDTPNRLSCTVLLAEAAETVTWTQPVDMLIRADQPLPLPKDKFFLLLADASVRGIVPDSLLKRETLRRAINPNNQKPLNWSD